MRRLVVFGLLFVLASGGGIAAASRLRARAGAWVWREGDSSVYVGEQSGSQTLVLHSPSGINLRASHVRTMSDDGVWELVHGATTPMAQVNAYYIGTATRTPIQIGAGSNPTTALVVAGSAGQKADLQQWTLSGKTVAAIDGQGRLRLGNVTLDLEVVNGRAELFAVTKSGRQLLAAGTTP